MPVYIVHLIIELVGLSLSHCSHCIIIITLYSRRSHSCSNLEFMQERIIM
jgi:hypothetical protein